MRKRYFFLMVIILIIIVLCFDKSNNFSYSSNIDNNLLNIYNTDIYRDTDIVGYISIDNTSINDFILQGDDNNYYLKHTKENHYNDNGEIFLDYRNQVNDKKLLVYGHNFRNGGGKFHDLVKYTSQDYYKDNKFIKVIFMGIDKIYQIFSVMLYSNKDDKHMKLYFNDQEYLEYLEYLKDNSLYETGIDININDKIILLQTCYYEEDNQLLLVIGKEVEKGEYENKI